MGTAVSKIYDVASLMDIVHWNVSHCGEGLVERISGEVVSEVRWEGNWTA